MNFHALCFVDMPFGQKPDLKSGVIVDFDQIYNAIKLAIEQCGLEPLRGDEENTGGIIHSAMFARLLLSEFVVVDPPAQCHRSRIRRNGLQAEGKRSRHD